MYQTSFPMAFSHGAMSRAEAQYLTPPDDYRRTKQDIDDAMPYDYISKIVVITNGEVEHTAKFISAKFAEVYGGGVTFDFRFSELSGSTVMVMVHQGKADRFKSKQLNDRINEIETVIEGWL